MTSENEPGSISACFGKLADGDEEAVAKVWERYFDALVVEAKKRLANVPRKSFDEEDVALSVLECLRRGAEDGRFAAMRDRTELWKLLVRITSQKAIDRIRRETAKKRGGGATLGEVDLGRSDDRSTSIDQWLSSQPTADQLVEMEEEKDRLFSILRDDSLRRVAVFRLEGYSNAEIAKQLGIVSRSVERKLQLIREAWERELNHES